MVSSSIPLMNQLASMAGIPAHKARRMVLVLDVEDCPRLFVEGCLSEEEPLISTDLEVSDEVVVVDMRGGIEVRKKCVRP